MMPDRESGALKDTVLSISNPTGRGIVIRAATPSDQPMRPLAEYEQKVVRLRQRMLQAAADLEFEEAALLRDKIRALEQKELEIK